MYNYHRERSKENEMKSLDEFYHGAAWKKCRSAFIRSRKGLCERCQAEGAINAGTQVHHRIRLTLENVGDPEISLNWENLELLCAYHHEEEHGKHKQRTDEFGHVEL